MQKRWHIKQQGDKDTVEQLANELSVEPLVASLLVQRGINTFEEAKKFFRPQLSHLHDPFLMKDMDKAVERIRQAISNHEKILVFGDYDVDGTTAVSLVYTFIKGIYPAVDYYIPDRFSEGYGISVQGVEHARNEHYSLVIALDCGIKSVDKIALAREYNIDFIVCDHHLPGDELPAAYAILNPKQSDCNYPYKDLSGCGIGFKLVQAYVQDRKMDPLTLEQFLDLAAISIAADIVPITGENRVLMYFGLQHINNNPRPGIASILELTQVKKELSVSDLVFTIGPRINAAGRLKSGRSAVELLVADTREKARTAGDFIHNTNNQRREEDAKVTREALEMFVKDPTLARKKTTVVYHEEWNKGVVGIVASRLTEKYYRPTIVLTGSDGKVTGSARSVKNYDVYAAIEKCSHLLEQYGGHKFAAGLTLKRENLDTFIVKFEEVVQATIEEYMLIPEIEIDAEISLNEISPKLFRILQQFAPFGPENMAPVFLTRQLTDKGYARTVGAEGQHLKTDLVDPNKPTQPFPAIGFGLGDKLPLVQKGQLADICYTIEENVWNGQSSLQLNIKDLKSSGQ